MIRNISIILSIFIPKRILENKVSIWLKYAGYRDDERIWAGNRLFFALLIGLIGFLIPFSVFPIINLILGTELFFSQSETLLIMIIFGLAFFSFIILIFYLHLSYVIDGRKKMVENILPDFLYLVGNNLKSGMTPFYAFRSAVRPEFGPLSEEIQIATKKSLGVSSFADSLRDIAARIDSKILADTAKFFAYALRSGGKLAQLIDTSANDIKQTNELKKELVSSTKMYVIFIMFVVIIASPILLAVSVQFLNILSSIESSAQLSGTGAAAASGAIGFSSGGASIDSEFMTNLGYILIITNSVLASIFIGIIGGGKIREGIKFAPIIIIGGIAVFMIVLQLVGTLVGTFS